MDTISYIDKVHKKEITIETKNLIKPQELYKHIGERLIFHNGFGYVVSGILEKADKEFNLYQYDVYVGVDYSNELDISYFYCNKDDPDSILDLEEMYYSLYIVKIEGIVRDRIIDNCKYIAIPSKEEKEFIDNILSMSNEEIIDNYEKVKSQSELCFSSFLMSSVLISLCVRGFLYMPIRENSAGNTAEIAIAGTAMYLTLSANKR